MKAPVRSAPRRAKTLLEEKEQMFRDISKDIDDRHQFLHEMRVLGQAATYESQIMGEISQRVKQLKGIDRDIVRICDEGE